MLEPSERERSLGRYFPALDGLRALSVLAVIAFHAELAGMRGGFLGVEVFFVISGYLITSLLLAEWRSLGRISLPDFWRRRARRLLPALFALLVCSLFASLWLAPDSLDSTRSDLVAACLYVSNWWQLVHHHSYFMAIERPPLLLHLWSLAVEEQFYLVWPLCVALLARVAPRWFLPTALCGAFASALWQAHSFDPALDPTRIYIGTDCRLSGLLLGAALAVVWPASSESRLHSSARACALLDVLAASGLALLSFAVVTWTSHDALVYRGGLVLIDLASCALIAALVAPTRMASLLGAPSLAWIGRRSYGLYLWHWPIFALTRPDQDLTLSGVRLLLLRVALTFACSELCYRCVETPVRNGALSWSLARLRPRPLLFAACAALIAAFAVALATLTDTHNASARLSSASPIAESRTTALRGGPTPSAPAPSSELELGRGVPLDPAWPKTLTLLSDSVTLGVTRSLPLALPDWKVEVLGRPALMVKQVVPEFLNARGVGSVVVVGLAYNSLFEKDRKNYGRWSALWDRGAEKLLADLKACGAKKVVWITLREPAPDLVTEAGRDQYEKYAWFFPYVNERIRALGAHHPELAIADWQAVSNVPNITKDLIHLNATGVALMTRTITSAVLAPNAVGG
ncbi:MAG TPA: acyltransferase family protein [Polyangiaceae bacterium]|jgi:peptidoglycan/LPS O-acetylase OafA/YrhL